MENKFKEILTKKEEKRKMTKCYEKQNMYTDFSKMVSYKCNPLELGHNLCMKYLFVGFVGDLFLFCLNRLYKDFYKTEQ